MDRSCKRTYRIEAWGASGGNSGQMEMEMADVALK